MTAETDYASLAERYWRTYRPSAYARIAPQERAGFFQDLARQVAELVEILAEDNLRVASRPIDRPEQTARRAAMARLRAEEEALRELVYLDKEPGTEDREMPRAQQPIQP